MNRYDWEVTRMGSMARCAGLCVLLAASLAAATSLPAAASQLPNPATLLAAQTPQPELPAGQICYKIEIEADGLYTVSYEALLAAGLNVTHTPPLSLALSWRGQPVAVEDVGDGDQVFEPGEGLRFFGLKFHASVQDEKYTDTDVYWLGVSEAGGARIQSRPADLPGDLPPLGWFTDTLRAEASRAWWSRWTNKPQSSDTWFWDYVNTTQTVTRVYTTSVPFPASGDYAIIVRANAVARESSLYGFRQHHLRFSFNDALVADTSWYGGSQGPERTVSRSLDTAYLLSGTNSLTMTVLTDTTSREQLFFNWFELTYRRAFTAAGGELRFSLISSGVVTVAGLSLPDARAYDTSIPTQPVRIALPTSGPVSFEAGPGSYWLSSPGAERAPARLSRYSVPELDPPGGADYVIITHASLLAQAERLAAFHTGRGLKVAVADAADLYNQYNGGVYHPEAIRRYLWHAYDTWPRRP
ncbi:MAG: hypothetical protein JW850_04750, partial [Thermoflexales bacterium]|nr:hypothetical protein [Thermoflexales bacterium]